MTESQKVYQLRCTNPDTKEHTRTVANDGRASFDVTDSRHSPKSKAEQLRGLTCHQCSGRLLGVSEITSPWTDISEK